METTKIKYHSRLNKLKHIYFLLLGVSPATVFSFEDCCKRPKNPEKDPIPMSESEFIQDPRSFTEDLRNFGKIKKMVQSGFNIEKKDRNGWATLHYAIRSDNLEMVEFLIDHRANVNLRTGKRGMLYDTPLHLAVKGNHLEIARCLILAGANVNAKNTWTNYRPLHCAINKKNLEMIELLIDNEALMEIPDPVSFQTPFHYAAQCGDVKVLQYMIDCGVNVNIQDHYGQTPLDLAIICKNYEAVELLRNVIVEK